MDKQSVFLVSYWPMLDYRRFANPPGQTLSPEKLQDIDLPDVHVEACLWTMDKDDQTVFTPVLIVAEAQEIVYHLNDWTEGKPQDWFKLAVTDNGHNYLVALFPNVQRSIERWCLNYKLTYGQDPPTNYEFRIMFRPLVFGAAISESYRSVRKLYTGKPMSLGLLDLKDFDPKNPFAADPRQIINLGKYNMADLSFIGGWADDYLTNLQPPKTGSFSMVNPAVKLE